MKYRTEFTAAAREQLRKIDKRPAMAILRKLAELEHNPLGLATTALVGAPDVRRLRVGDYRVLYRLDNGRLVILVVQIGHRSAVYDN